MKGMGTGMFSGSHAVGYAYMLISTTSFTGMAAVSKIIGLRASTQEKARSWRHKLTWRRDNLDGFEMLLLCMYILDVHM